MMKEIWFLLGNNLYDSKRYFSSKFAEALNRRGIRTKMIDFLKGDPKEQLLSLFQTGKPDLCCSFYNKRFYPGYTFWDRLQVPLWRILTDPPLGWDNIEKARYTFYSCVDHNDCAHLKDCGYEHVFFWGHGVPQDIAPEPNQERPYSVVFLGTSFDTQAMKALRQNYSPPIVRVIERSIECYMEEEQTPIWEIVESLISAEGIEPTPEERRAIYELSFNYCHGWDRLQLVRAIKEAPVEIYGGCAGYRYPTVGRGWAFDLAGQHNVTLHPAVTFDKGIEIMKRAKICLNSMLFFRQGTHERLFHGAACGCLMVNTATPWVKQHFEDRKDLVLYSPLHWERANEMVNNYLSHEDERQIIAKNGRDKVMQEHTWDHRVEEMLQKVPIILDKIKKNIS